MSKVVLVALALLGNEGELNGFFPADAFVVGACLRFGGRVAPVGPGLACCCFVWRGALVVEAAVLLGLGSAEAFAPGGRVRNCFGGKDGAGLGFQIASTLVVTGVSAQGWLFGMPQASRTL